MAAAFVQILTGNLTSLIQNGSIAGAGVDKEMRKLLHTLTFIRAVVEDAGDEQLQRKPFQIWLRNLNGIAYEIDDILEECAAMVSIHERKGSRLTSFQRIFIDSKIGRRMKEAAARFGAAASEYDVVGLLKKAADQPRPLLPSRWTSSLVVPGDIYGREEDTEKIVDILVGEVRERQQLCVLPIIGLGGIGKTALAQLVYNDRTVKEQFEVVLWVCASDIFDPKILLERIVDCGTGSRSAASDLEALHLHLSEKLHHKRYLLVLDDLWIADAEKWDIVKRALPGESYGAATVVTTRLKRVADVVGTLPAHHLRGLTDEECWWLLRGQAFGGRNEECHPDLEYIGRQIAKKCAGVPLAAKALGRILLFKEKEIREWIHVNQSEIWDLPEETSILPTLRLSYRDLPLVCQCCFAYCSVFPKGCTIEKQDLIFRWMAHGFISSDQTKQVEDVGDHVWNELVSRFLFQEVKATGRKTTCKMHNLVNDLAKSIMVDILPGSAQVKDNHKVREVYVTQHSSIISSTFAAHLPTLTNISDYSQMRMLKLDSNMVELLPSAVVGKLKHLLLLDLSHSSIRTLPHTLCNLWNLQILNLEYCSHLNSLPKKMRYMANLRHILLQGCQELSHMPSRIGELTNLKTLSLFIVSDKVGNQLDELEHLNLIRGRLEIKHLERVQYHTTAKKANLVGKPNLLDLVLSWESDGTFSDQLARGRDDKVLEALIPHPNLETLEILGFRGYFLPRMTKMENLTKLVIEKCQSCSRLSLGHLPRIKSLYLRNLPALECILVQDEMSRFPSLTDMTLHDLPNLKGLLKEGGEEEVGASTFPNLRSLYIKGCQQLMLPPLPTLEELDAWDCSLSNLSSFSSKLENLTSLFLGSGIVEASVGEETLPEGPGNLKNLVVWNAGELRISENWFRGLKSLQLLVIDQCRMGICFADGWLRHLTTLEGLTICNCSDFVDLPEEIAYLHNLKSLELGNLPDMVSLTQALQHTPSLQSLVLYSLPELTSLPDWLCDLTSLVRLSIDDCPRVASLPASVVGMSNLVYLCISRCPQLMRRCERGKGEDWHKIAHIPQLSLFNTE